MYVMTSQRRLLLPAIRTSGTCDVLTRPSATGIRGQRTPSVAASYEVARPLAALHLHLVAIARRDVSFDLSRPRPRATSFQCLESRHPTTTFLKPLGPSNKIIIRATALTPLDDIFRVRCHVFSSPSLPSHAITQTRYPPSGYRDATCVRTSIKFISRQSCDGHERYRSFLPTPSPASKDISPYLEPSCDGLNSPRRCSARKVPATGSLTLYDKTSQTTSLPPSRKKP